MPIFNISSKMASSLSTMVDIYGNNLLQSIFAVIQTAIHRHLHDVDQSPAADCIVLMAYIRLSVDSRPAHVTPRCLDIVADCYRARQCALWRAGFVLIVCAAVANDPDVALQYLADRNMIQVFKDAWIGEASIDGGRLCRQASLACLATLARGRQAYDRYDIVSMADIVARIDDHVADNGRWRSDDDVSDCDDGRLIDLDAGNAREIMVDEKMDNGAWGFRRRRESVEVARLFSILDECLIRDPFEDVSLNQIVKYTLTSSFRSNKDIYQNYQINNGNHLDSNSMARIQKILAMINM